MPFAMPSSLRSRTLDFTNKRQKARFLESGVLPATSVFCRGFR
jgi:hypothetical protein